MPELADDLRKHPFAEMRRRRLSTTFCTDNRLVSHTTVSHEIARAVEAFDLTPREVRDILIYGFKRSFYPGSYLEKRDYVRGVIDYANRAAGSRARGADARPRRATSGGRPGGLPSPRRRRRGRSPSSCLPPRRVASTVARSRAPTPRPAPAARSGPPDGVTRSSRTWNSAVTVHGGVSRPAAFIRWIAAVQLQWQSSSVPEDPAAHRAVERLVVRLGRPLGRRAPSPSSKLRTCRPFGFAGPQPKQWLRGA